MARQVASNDWSTILYHEDRDLVELKWLPSTGSMGDGGFKATLMQLAWQAETLRPSSLMIDATDFAHKFAERDNALDWLEPEREGRGRRSRTRRSLPQVSASWATY
jgi:hypothetical protein